MLDHSTYYLRSYVKGHLSVFKAMKFSWTWNKDIFWFPAYWYCQQYTKLRGRNSRIY